MGARMDYYKENEIIISESEISSKMYLVLEGEVILYVNYKKSNEYVLGVCGKGKVFGEMGLLCEEPSMYTAVAFSNVKIAWFEKNNLSQFIYGYPDNAVGLMEKIARSNLMLKANLDMAYKEINNLKPMTDISAFEVDNERQRGDLLNGAEKSAGYRFCNDDRSGQKMAKISTLNPPTGKKIN